MDIVSAFSGVTAGLSVTSSADARDAEREQGIPKVPRFPRAQHNPHLGKANPEGTERLDKLSVAERKLGLEIACSRPQPGQADSK